MMTENDATTEQYDALMMVSLRNAFYKAKYRLLLGVYFLCIAVIAILLGMFVYLLRHPPHPLYFVADEAGRLIQEVPVQQANMSNEEVAAWVVEAVEAAYSYNFVNYRSQLQNAQKYFATGGWREYMKALTASNNLLALTQRRQVVIAKVAGAPQLLKQGPSGSSNAMTWQFKMPVLITYLQPPYDKPAYSNPWVVSIIVRRQKILESYKGLGVLQMIGDYAGTPVVENLTAPPT